MTFRNVSSTSPISFQPDRVKEGRGHIGEKGRKKFFSQYANIHLGYLVSFVGMPAVSLQFIRIRVAHSCVCVLEEKRKFNLLIFCVSSSPRLSLIAPSIYLPSPSPFPREVERPFEICRWPKAREPRSVRPRVSDSYLLTESSRKGVIEQCYCSRMSSGVARLRGVYASLRRLTKAFTTKFSNADSFSVQVFLSLCLGRFLALLFLRLCKTYARSWNVQNLLQIAIFFDNESFW